MAMNITMPRGDIRHVTFTITDSCGEPFETEFDEIYFTVKDNFKRAEYHFQKKLSEGTIINDGDGNYSFTIMPEDTNNLSFKQYVFDIEMVLGTEIKSTVVGMLIITEEATYAENE